MITRIQPRAEALLHQFPAVALLGPRQVGKTTLALEIARRRGEGARYLDLEQPSDRARLLDPESYLRLLEDRLVILDEIHRMPEIFRTLRGLIDRWRRKGKPAGHFLLLGSASMDLLRQTSESLAGRIAYAELGPFSPLEVAGVGGGPEQLWSRGGFPDSFLAPTDAASFEWRAAFIQTYLERDVPALGPRIAAETLHRYWQMLAHNQGQILNAARLAAGLGLSGQTVARYLDLMVDLLLVRRLPPWTGNIGKRLVRSPKVYVRDSGLVHALLGIPDREMLLGHPVVGSSWEGWHIENILNALPRSAWATFYRTSAGAEIDLVLELGPRDRWAIEIKRSLAHAGPSKGFYLGCADVKATRQIVLCAADEAYPLGPKTEAIPLAQFLRELALYPTRV